MHSIMHSVSCILTSNVAFSLNGYDINFISTVTINYILVVLVQQRCRSLVCTYETLYLAMISLPIQVLHNLN